MDPNRVKLPPSTKSVRYNDLVGELPIDNFSEDEGDEMERNLQGLRNDLANLSTHDLLFDRFENEYMTFPPCPNDAQPSDKTFDASSDTSIKYMEADGSETPCVGSDESVASRLSIDKLLEDLDQSNIPAKEIGDGLVQISQQEGCRVEHLVFEVTEENGEKIRESIDEVLALCSSPTQDQVSPPITKVEKTYKEPISRQTKILPFPVLSWGLVVATRDTRTISSCLAKMIVEEHDAEQKLIHIKLQLHANQVCPQGPRSLLHSFEMNVRGDPLKLVDFAPVERDLDVTQEVTHAKSREARASLSPSVICSGVCVTGGLPNLLSVICNSTDTKTIKELTVPMFDQTLHMYGNNTEEYWRAERLNFIHEGRVFDYKKNKLKLLKTSQGSYWDWTFLVDFGRWQYTDLSDLFTLNGRTEYAVKSAHKLTGLSKVIMVCSAPSECACVSVGQLLSQPVWKQSPA